MLIILIRTVLIYFILALLMQLTGKRQIGQLQVSELLCALLLSELAAAPISDSSIPLTHAILPILVLSTLEVIVSFLVTKSPLIRSFFDGEPSILVNHGKLDQRALASARINLDELLGFMRLQGISTLADVDYAILEQNGQISFLPKAHALAASAEEQGISVAENGIAHPLVVDGKLQEKQIAMVSRTTDWVLAQLALRHCRLTDVFLYTLDDGAREILILREQKKEG